MVGVDLAPALIATARRLAAAEGLNIRFEVGDCSPRSVPQDIIEQALLAAGTAPSGANMQPWRFVIASLVLVALGGVTGPARRRNPQLRAERVRGRP